MHFICILKKFDSFYCSFIFVLVPFFLPKSAKPPCFRKVR